MIEKYGHKIYFDYGSSTGHPEYKGMQTCDIKLWVKIDDNKWFRPYGSFDISQIQKMIDICRNEFQLVSLMELLSTK